VLSVRNLGVRYGLRAIVRDISLDLNAGEVLAIIGKNGSGKSTILKAIVGLIPRCGNVWYGTRLLNRCSIRTIGQLGLDYVGQTHDCFSDLTIVENLEAALLSHNLPRNMITSRRQSILRQFPTLTQIMSRPARGISGGQLQLLVIAMALIRHPRLLLLDEPSVGLSPEVLVTVISQLRQYVADGGCVLLVEHNTSLVAALNANRCYLDQGMLSSSTRVEPSPLRTEAL